MNFLTMEYFLAVASKRNITKAAAELNITQQTLSSHISNLEKELGARLIVRSSPLTLTYEGEVFLKHAANIYESYQAMWNEFNDLTLNQRGKLAVGIDLTRSHTLMPAVISSFQQLYANIQICVFEGTNEDIHDALIRKDIDLAIALFPENIPGIETRPYYREEVVMVVPNALAHCGEIKSGLYLDTIEEFKDYPFLLSNQNDIAGMTGTEIIRRSDFQPHVKARSNNIETLLDLCLNGIGICFCTQSTLRAMVSRDQLNNVLVYHFINAPIYKISFAYRKTSYQWKMISEFIRISILERDRLFSMQYA